MFKKMMVLMLLAAMAVGQVWAGRLPDYISEKSWNDEDREESLIKNRFPPDQHDWMDFNVRLEEWAKYSDRLFFRTWGRILIPTVLSVWAYNAGWNSRESRARFFCRTGTLVFAFMAVYRFGGALQQ